MELHNICILVYYPRKKKSSALFFTYIKMEISLPPPPFKGFTSAEIHKKKFNPHVYSAQNLY